jgi:hypothetical protein
MVDIVTQADCELTDTDIKKEYACNPPLFGCVQYLTLSMLEPVALDGFCIRIPSPYVAEGTLCYLKYSGVRVKLPPPCLLPT